MKYNILVTLKSFKYTENHYHKINFKDIITLSLPKLHVKSLVKEGKNIR